jgi:hypothetical protein
MGGKCSFPLIILGKVHILPLITIQLTISLQNFRLRQCLSRPMKNFNVPLNEENTLNKNKNDQSSKN